MNQGTREVVYWSGPAPRRVSVVVAGAGARGGYEAGVLSVLVPRLRGAGVEVVDFVGTSAGAINATIFAALAHLPAEQQARRALRVWRGITVSDVFRSPSIGLPRLAGSAAGQFLHIPGVQLTHLLDTAPLRRTAERVVDWKSLRANIDSGITTLAVVATSGADNRTVVFVDRADRTSLPQTDDERPIDYVSAEITAEHVLASAAIPIAFPPVHVSDPRRAGWYLDGGIRLNAPLKPAIALGTDAIAMVATHPVVDATTSAPADERPIDVDDVVVRLMDAALVDRMIEDMRTLDKVNMLVDGTESTTATGRPRQVIPFFPITPPARKTLGDLAEKVFAARHHRRGGILPALRQAELRMLGRVLGGDGPRRGDLFSYLYFDNEFIEASIELGRRDAHAALDASPSHHLPWQIGTRIRSTEDRGIVVSDDHAAEPV
ncbi:patatin-like phospholipase family protein [Nocardia bovistercoris]|uniref:Patatin-like phospholipase family protein n=1 Tax=Nocardia bovistercoris TaxID=2785916 RepID=A0A931IJF3_9NOCA|nr:patatin-like phospholipase family protein [Nocardia bovistercoris]MBH0780693.1 patatin-like phospholipase family protein [Nocardia bovistercoris]